MSFRITNENKNKDDTNDGLAGFRIFDNYRNKNARNDGKEGFRIIDNFKGTDRPPMTLRNIYPSAEIIFDGSAFGLGVAISGNKIVIGAQEDLSDKGSAFVYDATTYGLLTKLVASDGAGTVFFGHSVAISETNNKIVVGAHLNTIGINDSQGSVYVYDATTFAQLANLTASDGTGNDRFGWSVAISDNKIVIGAYNDTVGLNVNQGSVYVFNATTLSEITKLTASDGTSYDNFGNSVAISESSNKIVVGAYGDNINANNDQGSVYIYDATTFAELAKIVASDGVGSDNFGRSVAISSNKIIVGAPNHGAQGSVYIFDANFPFTQLAKITSSDGASGDNFGFSVAISDASNRIVVGASNDDINANDDQGSVYIFNANFPYTQLAKLASPDGVPFSYFGSSVAIDKTTVVVGAPYVNQSIAVIKNIL